MKSAIKRLYMIEQPHHENINQTKKYWEAVDKLCKLLKKIDGELTDEQKKTLNDINEAHDEMNSEAIFAAYKAGFKYGLQIGIEVADE